MMFFRQLKHAESNLEFNQIEHAQSLFTLSET